MPPTGLANNVWRALRAEQLLSNICHRGKQILGIKHAVGPLFGWEVNQAGAVWQLFIPSPYLCIYVYEGGWPNQLYYLYVQY